MPNMVTRATDWMLILRQNKEDPLEPEWDQCLRLLAQFKSDFKRVRVLVVTEGGGPSPAQRKRLSFVTGGFPLRAAVVTDSIKVRFVVSSVALFMSGLASFDVSELHRAYAHLGFDLRQQLTANRLIREMTAEVTGARPLLIPEPPDRET